MDTNRFDRRIIAVGDRRIHLDGRPIILAREKGGRKA